MKKIILSILALVLITLGVIIFCVIRSFNAENYKDQVITTIAQIMGKKVSEKPEESEVKISGEVTLSWRPMPTFIMNDLTVANQRKESAPMIKIPQVQVEIEWLSLLKSPLVIKKIILKKPEILVERERLYQTNFAFPVLFNPARSVEQDTLMASSGDFLVQIEALEIEGGTLYWKNLLTKQEFTLQDINGTGKVDGIDGPYFFKGNLSFLNQKFDIDLETQKLAISTPLRMRIDLKNAQTELKITADLDRDSKEKWLTLNGTFSSQDSNEFFKLFNFKKWPVVAPVSGSYTLDILPQKNQLKKLILNQNKDGENLFTANVHWDQDAKNNQDMLSIELGKVDLSQWGTLLQDFANELPQENTVLDVKANEIKWGSFSGNKAQLTGKIANSKLSDGKLILPLADESSLIISGQYDLKKKTLSGDISFGTMDALVLLNTSFPEIKKYLPSQKFKQLQLTGKLTSTPEAFHFETTTAIVDDLQFSGKLGYDFTKENWTSQLNMPELNLDQYYSVPNDFGNQLLGKIKGTEKESPYTSEMTWNFDFSSDRLTLKEVPFKSFALKGELSGKALDIQDFSVQVNEENTLDFKGKISQFGTLEPIFQKATLSGKIKDFALADQLGFSFPKKTTEKLEDLTGSIAYEGTIYQGEIDTTLQSGGAELSVKGQIKDLFTHPTLTQNDVHLFYPNLSKLADLIYPDKRLFATYPISVDFKGKLALSSDKIQWQDALLSLGDDQMNIQGSFDFTPMNLQTQIKATRLNLDLLFSNLSEFIKTPTTPITFDIDSDFSANISILSDVVSYPQGKGKNLNALFLVKDKNLTIKEFSFVPSDIEDAQVVLSGTLDFDSDLSVKTEGRIVGLKVPEKIWRSSVYAMGNGYISGDFNLQAKGKNWQELVNSLKTKGTLAWQEGELKGVDVPVWNEAVYSALKIGQISEGFKSRLDTAFKEGRTKLPTLTGKLSAQNGTLSWNDIQGENKVFIFKNAQIDWPILLNSTSVKIPMVLTILKTLPPIVVDIKGSSYAILTKDFLRAFQDEIKIKSQQLFQEQQLKEKQENDLKNAQMKKSAQSILDETDRILRSMQKKALLNSSKEANEKMRALEEMAQEIRHLAVKPNLTDSEHIVLLEKSKLLSAQAKDFENWFGVEDLMEQKKKVALLPQEGEKMLAEMEKIYQQNARSTTMADLVLNARKVMENIRTNIKQLEGIQDSVSLEELISLLKEDFIKLKKALVYMQKLNG